MFYPSFYLGIVPDELFNIAIEGYLSIKFYFYF